MASTAKPRLHAPAPSLKPVARPSKGQGRKDPGTDDEDDVPIGDASTTVAKAPPASDKRAREGGSGTRPSSSDTKRLKQHHPSDPVVDGGGEEPSTDDAAASSAAATTTATDSEDPSASSPASSSSSVPAHAPGDDKGKTALAVATQAAPTLTHMGTALPTRLQDRIGELQDIKFYDRFELFEKFADIDLFEILAIVRGGHTEWDEDDKATYGLHTRDISKYVFQSKDTGGPSTGKPTGAYLSFGEKTEGKDKKTFIKKITFSIPMFTATAIYTGLNTAGMANDNSRSPLFLLIGSTTLPHKVFEGDRFNDAFRFLLRVQQALINGWAITLGILCYKIMLMSFSEEHRATSWPAAVFAKLDGKVKTGLKLKGPAADKYTPTPQERLEEFLNNEAKCGFLPGKDGSSCLLSIKRRLVRPPSKKEKETLQQKMDDVRSKMQRESLDRIPVAERILVNDPSLALPDGTPLPVVAENIKRGINGVYSAPKVRKPLPRTRPGAPKPRPELWPIPDPIEGIPRKSVAPSLVSCQNVTLEFSIKSVDEFSKAMGSILSWNPYSDGHELNVETVLPKFDRGHDMKPAYDYEAMTGCPINAFDDEDYDDDDHDATAIP